MEQKIDPQPAPGAHPDGGGKPIRLLFFGHLPGITGGTEFDWQCAPGLRAGDLLEEIIAHWPALTACRNSLRMAVDCEYVRLEDPVSPGSEVAVMPPVQGG